MMKVNAEPMDGVTKARIAALRFSARRLSQGELDDLDVLAARFSLDPLIVRRVLEAEGLVAPLPRQVASSKSTTVELRAIK